MVAATICPKLNSISVNCLSYGRHISWRSCARHMTECGDHKSRRYRGNNSWRTFVTHPDFPIFLRSTAIKVPVAQRLSSRAGHLRYFFIFSLIKNEFFAFFIKLIWLGVGFLNRTDAEIGYWLDTKCKPSFLLLKKLKNTSSAQLCSPDSIYSPRDLQTHMRRHVHTIVHRTFLLKYRIGQLLHWFYLPSANLHTSSVSIASLLSIAF